MQTVILIDDSATFLSLLKKGLASKYNVVGQAQDGSAGIELYKKQRPDLVLLDITMPNVNGKDCLKGIMELNPSAKVIMVSSLGDDLTVRECLTLGAKAFVNKDSISLKTMNDQSPLLKTIEQVLESWEAV